MSKLQLINKKPSGHNYSLYLPRELVEGLGWVKGDDLTVVLLGGGGLSIKKMVKK